MSNPGDIPTLAELWPFGEISVPPQLAALPLTAFFSDTPPGRITAATWRQVSDAGVAPRASYALRLRRRDGVIDLSRWLPHLDEWGPPRRVRAESRGGDGCVVIDLNGIVLGNVTTTEALESRVRALLQRELGAMTAFRLTAMVFSVLSIMLLYFSIRIGVEQRAAEPFVLVFALAFMSGLTGGFLKTRSKAAAERGLARVRQQFQHEFRQAENPALQLAHVNATMRELELKREEAAVIVGFLLLLCFVYFVSPLMIISVMVALVLVSLITGPSAALRGLGQAYDRAERRLEQAALSFRAGHDQMSAPALRSARKQVLRDRIRRHGEVRAVVQKRQGRRQLDQDLAQALAFVIIFGTYAIAVATGVQKLTPGLGNSLVSTSLFSVAPVIVLLSISRSTTVMAKVVNRRLAILMR